MNAKLIIGMGLVLAMAGCVSTPQPNAALESARTAVQAAEANPNVSQYAALDLQAAKKQLEIGDAAALRHVEADIAQPAYLAAQNARLAQAHAAAKADEARVAAGQSERDKIQLAARTRDVESEKTATNTALAQRDQASEQSARSQADSARSQAESARLQAELDQLKATPTPRGLVLTLGDVLFDTGRSELKTGATRKLDQLAQFLTEHPDRRVQIDGFTDSVGTDSYNRDLSQRRADTVRSALITRGIDRSRIGSQGYGKEFPVADNSESGGRQLNRRVEVVIGGDGGSAIAGRGA